MRHNIISKALDLISNMGWRYVFFRIRYALGTKTGLLKKKFPTSLLPLSGLSLKAWRNDTPPFFFNGKNIPGLERKPKTRLEQTFEAIQAGEHVFFSFLTYRVADGAKGWHTNPETGYRYDAQRHWTEIADLSKEAGDIKFVWEKARFSFFNDVIRYDYHHEVDCSAFVFDQIESFIDNNSLNLGPQYKCSQEISLRVLNWTFALYYYKDSTTLTERRFQKIMQSIYGQLHHVYHNIHFSRITVRNNHAITETLMLYLSGLLFPFLPETAEWSRKGKRWFEQEVAYQIYDDGAFLQHSMNYHRVVVQLLTWGLRLAELHGQRFDPVVHDRAAKSLLFLDVCTDPASGQLPNYGANDGALFFRFTDDDYRVFTSQLNDLRMVLSGHTSRVEESIHWYGFNGSVVCKPSIQGAHSFEKGGYYILQEGNVKTFIRCGKYKDRPFQSDNLHLDVWAEEKNYLWDTGSYKYNTKKSLVRYFNGVEGHNTVSISGHDQMLKGNRFIWFYWIKNAFGKWIDGEKSISFEGRIDGFRHVGDGYTHNRKVIKQKGKLYWTILDEVVHEGKEELALYWHVNPAIEKEITLKCWDGEGQLLAAVREEKWYSRYYGQKETSIRYTYKTTTNSFKTEFLIST